MRGYLWQRREVRSEPFSESWGNYMPTRAVRQESREQRAPSKRFGNTHQDLSPFIARKTIIARANQRPLDAYKIKRERRTIDVRQIVSFACSESLQFCHKYPPVTHQMPSQISPRPLSRELNRKIHIKLSPFSTSSSNRCPLAPIEREPNSSSNRQGKCGFLFTL